MVSLGLDKLGYKYVNCDDCWATARDNVTGRLVPVGRNCLWLLLLLRDPSA